jgi:acyl-CoA synthetase (NDP forming)
LEKMRSRIEEMDPDSMRFLLQRMVKGGFEMIIGSRHDPTFGPVAVLGMGGIYVEIFKDTSIRIAPLTPFDANEMIDELRGSRLLEGVRGQKGVDIHALVEALLAISRLVCEHPEIEELDINPLVVQEHGALALDARVIIAKTKI